MKRQRIIKIAAQNIDIERWVKHKHEPCRCVIIIIMLQWASGGLKQEQEQRAHMRAPALGYVVDVPSSDSSERLRLADVDLLDHVCRGSLLVLVWQQWQWKSLQVLKETTAFWQSQGMRMRDIRSSGDSKFYYVALCLWDAVGPIHDSFSSSSSWIVSHHNNNNFQYCSRRKQNKISLQKK